MLLRQLLCQLWHLRVFSTANPSDCHWWKSDSKLKIISLGHFKTNSILSHFYSDLFSTLQQGWPCWTEPVLRGLVPSKTRFFRAWKQNSSPLKCERQKVETAPGCTHPAPWADQGLEAWPSPWLSMATAEAGWKDWLETFPPPTPQSVDPAIAGVKSVTWYCECGTV